jgi:hypothetical protein
MRVKEKATPKTRKMLLTFTEELAQAVEKVAYEKMGHRKGALSMYIELVLRNELHLPLKGVEEK